MAITSKTPRLSRDQVDSYQREGYLRVVEPVFPPEKFAALRDHFEQKLLRLPPDVRPEGMDVPHFTDLALFDWLFADEVLDLVEPIVGPDIALFSSHFICKPRGNGKRVPWHEDSFYWKGMMEPIEVCTVWLAIDPSTAESGCMCVVPRTHGNGYSEYGPVDQNTNVFWTEIKKGQFDESKAIPLELEPNQATLHDGRLIHGSAANHSTLRRCGYTMRYMSTLVKFNHGHQFGATHNIYLARGTDRAGNIYADPSKTYPDKARYKELHSKGGH